ncbi:gluconate 2-dehydrogenase subunit 3 family protein [Halomonas sp. ND22Bw]|uniref:Twin-arginine translocation pathway signal n=1 Tax=Halomonas salina TaxID=42565 RepID=A0ABR4WUR7_9GAMM|nr:gluconate 2-dehydrogenase subunit 3 family protein [Halomonas salina]KGE78479.1 Twin-arginine translocation pathway signal [Halomonas salina]PSJ21657.1 gluconate 2-dehydrogenase subunit 3 family protein [Halomonas sp. ND22Bw]
MNRRELLKMIAVATGTALVGGQALTAFAGGGGEEALTDADVRLLDEVAETLLPRTDTPGAKDAEVGDFMRVFVRDCYTAEQQARFRDGIARIEAHSRAAHGAGFLALDAPRRGEVVAALDREARARMESEARAQVDTEGEPHGFTLIKQLTLFGFFTSKVGGTEVLRYVAVPGRYDGDLAYEPGEPAWATT